MRLALCSGLTSLALLLPAAATLAEDAKKPAEVSFKNDIAPILVKNCQACHGPTDPKGNYQLHTFAALMKAGSSGDDSIAPGKPDNSELFRLVTSDEKEERMPKDGDPLSAEQIALVKRWIAEGAKFDGADKAATLASLVPKTAQPDPPEAYRVPMAVTAVAFRPDGKELAVGGYHEITIWDPEKGTLLRRIKNVAERTYALAYNQDGKQLAAASGNPGQLGEVKLFDPEKGAVLKELGTMSDSAYGVAFNPAGTKVAACGADRSIRIYDVASGKEERLIEDHADWVMAIAWNNDGTRLVSGSRDKTSKVFDVTNGESLTTFPGHGETVYGVAFSADGKQVFSSGGDKKIQVWNPADGKKIADMPGYGGDVYRVILAGDQIISCSADKTARQHKAADRTAIRSLTGNADYVYAVDVNVPTKRIASGSYDGDVRIWNMDDGKEVIAFKAAPGYVAPQQAKK